MMNAIAISLMLASMAFAGIWSPSPEAAGGDHVIMKGGHRAVVVEYADDNAGQINTKVYISPPLTSATAAVDGMAQDAKKAALGPEEEHGWGARELICDAFGKCRHKISRSVYKTKDKVRDTAHEMEEGTKETIGSVMDKAKEVSSKSTNAAEQGVNRAKRSVSIAKDAADDTVEDLRQKGKAAMDKAGEATEKVKRKGNEATKEMSDIAERGKEVVYDAISCLTRNEFYNSFMRLIHLLGFATSYGMVTWVAFAMSHLLARSLPRQQFGVVQSRIYPVYFKALASAVGLALLGHLLGRSRQPEASSAVWRLQVYNLVGSMALVLVNLHFLEPQATKAMYERMKIEKEEGTGVSAQATRLVDHSDTLLTSAATTTTTTGETKSKMERLNRKLKKLSSYSSLLNVMTLMGLTWHLVYLSQRICG